MVYSTRARNSVVIFPIRCYISDPFSEIKCEQIFRKALERLGTALTSGIYEWSVLHDVD